MKKKVQTLTLCIITIVALTLTLTGCNEPPEIIYENEAYHFTLSFPSNWEDNYLIKEQIQGIDVYHQATYHSTEGHAGRIFSIYIFSKEEWEKEGQELANLIGLTILKESEDKIYTLAPPTDVQSSQDNKKWHDQYKHMKKDLPAILESLQIEN
ncbi:hypothetical protein F9B85_11470 [Heliorestis acidaminivorans]|uniref:DUF4825 domain-containing protein n=1 Tax=Heliorestis acidaminivorans TaxID=553427 RepID=A0A6I0EQK0_9FIRM|nr:hypothetical protein [Heliorestis acidaminivorans]KAB2951646.1 hypothetical protein F9B85_11470 [Heliorestis acidaminivorans]